MKQLIKYINATLALFLILTVIILLSSLFDAYIPNDKTQLIIKYIGPVYMILLYIILIILVVCLVIGAIYGIKRNGLKGFVKEAAISFLGGFLLLIILSLIKNKIFLDTDKLYIPFVSLCIPSVARFFSIRK